MTIERSKILIIDDIPANVMTLGEVLSDEFELQFALSGAEGLVLAAQLPHPDLILLDVLMPNMDGYQTCLRLKEDPHLQKIPIIFVTALSDSYNESKSLTLNAADYIAKPINIHIAELRIRNLLERERQRKEIEFYRDSLEMLVEERSQSLVTAQEQLEDLQKVIHRFMARIRRKFQPIKYR